MADWKQALQVVADALGVIKNAAAVPGINLIPYVDTISAAATALSAALSAGVKIAPYIEAIKDSFSGGLPSDEQHRALDMKIEELEALVDAPLPPREGDEPE